METGIGPLDFGKSSVLDLAKHVTFRAPSELVYRVSRSALLVFVGFILGQATHEKSDIEKVYDRVNSRRAELLQATSKEHEPTRSVDGQQVARNARGHDNSKP